MSKPAAFRRRHDEGFAAGIGQQTAPGCDPFIEKPPSLRLNIMQVCIMLHNFAIFYDFDTVSKYRDCTAS